MDVGKLLGQIISRLRDQRLLFLIAVGLVVAALGSTKVLSTPGILALFGISAVVVVVDRTFEFFETRTKGLDTASQGFAMLVETDFEGIAEGESIQLEERARCTIQDPRSPSGGVVTEVLLHEGPGEGGWLCPVPPEAGVNDMVSFTLTATDGRQWHLNIVPGLSWPRKTARRIS